MKNEYSEHQTDQLLCIFSQDFTYRSRHIETDAILSSAQPCHVHCARVRVRVCVWGGGTGAGLACTNLTGTLSLRSKLPCKLRFEAWLVEPLKNGLCSFF